MKLITYIALVSFCFLLSLPIYAQEYSLSGTIKDDNNTSVPYANILILKQADSTIVSGTSTNDNGKFIFELITKGNYIIRTSFIGFETIDTSISLKSNLELDAIILKESTESLDEVSVIYKKPTLKKEADRLVFNVENSALTEGNIMDVLKSTPSVLVIEDEIKVKLENPRVYINDKKVNISSSEIFQLLEGTSASTIQEVEVITNPGAKYDAESGVVLNIKMSKNLIIGYSGSVFANYTQGTFPRQNIGMSNFYKTKKINFFGSYSYTNKIIGGENIDIINYNQNNTLTENWETNSDLIKWSNQHTVSLIFDYFMSKKSTLSLSSNLLFLPYWKGQTNAKTNVLDDNLMPSYNFNSQNINRDNKHNLGFDIDFKQQLKKEGEQISVNLHYTNYDYDKNQNVVSNYFMNNGNFDFNNTFRTDANQGTNIFTSQIDYELPLGENSKLETGIKYSGISTKSDYNRFNFITNSFVQDITNSDSFDYDENVFAAYINYSTSIKKWSLSAGLRGEQTDIKGISLNTTENKQDYFELFPTLSVNYDVTDNLSFYTNYKRTISRPNYNYLNPFRYFINDNAFVSGNPNLLPGVSSKLYLGTAISQRYFFEAFYIDTKNESASLAIQDNTNNILQYVASNIQDNIYYGLDFITYFDVLDNWSVDVVTSGFYLEDNFINENDIKTSLGKWSNYTQIGNNLSFLNDNSLKANVSFLYIAPIVEGFANVSDRTTVSASLSKKLFKNKATLSLSVNDIFDSSGFSSRSQYLNQDSYYRADFDNQSVRIGFRYNFGNTKLETNERTKELEERDRLIE